MYRITFSYFLILYFSYFAGAQSAQYPVRVSGFMIPPHSLDLKVYAYDRAADLNFQMILNDPKEVSLDVIPVLSIEQNGTVIYQTDLNVVNPITLYQFEPTELKGEALNPLLSIESLRSASGGGFGSTLIPEGFYNICLQLYGGVNRLVPVSNKFCISANFRLNQPPQIIKPAFKEKIKIPAIQNMIFSWMPMHLSSGNNPGAVEYVFEMVELPAGVMNANDAFEASLKVYTTTVNTPSLIYTPAEPILKPNTYYAWRVTARSLLHPTSTLFQNEGKSEISIFLMYDGDAPSTEFNPFDKSSPRGCSVYETSYGPVDKADNTASILSPNQIVQVGYFSMKIVEANGSPQQGYSGRGLIEYPMLRSTLEVYFNNIMVNSNNRVFRSESIKAAVNPSLAFETRNLTKERLQNSLNSTYLNVLDIELSSDNKNVMDFPANNLTLNELPLLLRKDDIQPSIAVVGFELTPSNAYLNLVSRTSNNAVFAASLIPTTPHGLKNQSHLVPIYNEGLVVQRTKILESVESGDDFGGETKMYCDCNGFTSMSQSSVLNISDKILQRADSNGPVTFETKSKSKRENNSISEIRNISNFRIIGFDGFEFISRKGVLDLSEQENLGDWKMNDYTAVKNPSWKGVILSDIQTKLPSRLNFFNNNNNKDLLLDRGDIVIDENELAYGNIYKTNVLSLDKGKMGPWNYSVDTLQLKINNQISSNLLMNGQIKTPFFKDQFDYHATIKDNARDDIKLNATIPNSELTMDIWHGKFKVKPGSSIDAKAITNENEITLAAKANFNGDLRIDFTDSDFNNSILNENKGLVIDEVKKALEVDDLSFDLSNFQIQGFTSDPYQERPKRYSVKKFDFADSNLKIGGLNQKITGASLQLINESEEDRLGLKLIVVKNNKKVELIIWAKSNNKSLLFEGIEINNVELKCNCTASNVIPTKEEWEKIIDDYYNKVIVSNEGHKDYITGLMSFEPVQYLFNYKEFVTSIIKQNAISWFPASMDGTSIYIPFLDRNLAVESKNNVYYGMISNPAFDPSKKINWTEKLFNSLNNSESGDLVLPLVITKELWSKFGFKGEYTLPENFKLYVSEFKSSTDKLTSATIRIDLVGILVGGAVHFSSIKDIPIGPDKVTLKDVQLALLHDVMLNQNVIYLASQDNKANQLTSDNDSYANLSCEDGLSSFNIQGNFICANGTIQNMNATGTNKPASFFGFRLIENRILDNADLLAEFIAPLKEKITEKEGITDWKFATKEDQHIVFSPGSSFSGFLDFSKTKSVALSQNEKNSMFGYRLDYVTDETFTGLVFNQMMVEIPSLELKRNKDNSIDYIKDAIYNSYFEMETNSFFASFQRVNIIPKENNARLGGWRYVIDTLSFDIIYNELDANKLVMQGATKIPIFKEAPEKDKEKWLEDYSDAWVKFSLNMEYSKKINNVEIQGTVNNVQDSLFESVHIDNLGFKLLDECSIDFYYDQRSKKLLGRANFNGRGVYTIKKLDAKITTFQFQDLKLNYNASGLCKSGGMDGIESIDFGTWGVGGFSAQEKEVLKKAAAKLEKSKAVSNIKNKLSENKFAKSIGSKFDGFNKIASFDMNLHQPTFTCTGSEYKLIIGLDISIMRDKSNLTESQQKAYDKYNPVEAAQNNKTREENAINSLKEDYEKAQQEIKKIAKERADLMNQIKEYQDVIVKVRKEKEKDFKTTKGLAMSVLADDRSVAAMEKILEIRKQEASVDKKFKESITKAKEKYKPYKEQNAKVKQATLELDAQQNMAVLKQAQADEKNKTIKGRLDNAKSDFKSKLKEAKETKTGAFSAGGDIEVSFTSAGFKDVALTCLQVGGEFGPVKFNGGINLFRDETTKETFDPNAIQSEWGNGFLGLIELKILSYEFKTKFQTGVRLDQANTMVEVSDYRYWFGDISFNANPGIPLGPTGFSITGVGGGVYYNMAQVSPEFDAVKKISPDTPETNAKNKKQTANNDLCKVQGLKAGESLSGMQYKVEKNAFGGYIMAEFSHTSRISLENTISIEMKNTDDGLKFRKLGLAVNGYLFYTDYDKRKSPETPGIVKGNININFEDNIQVYGGIDFRFGKKAGPISIGAPVDKNENANSWNQIKFLFSKDQNYVHAGSWGAPSSMPFYRNDVRPASDLNFLSAGFEAPLLGKAFAGLYVQAGSKIDAFPSITNFMPTYKGAIKPLPSDQSSGATNSGVIAGFVLSADFKGNFFVVDYKANGLIGANLSVAKFKKTDNCNSDGSAVGFSNGYYARGNAFAHLDAKVNLDVNLLFARGKYEIFKGSMDFIMDFGFPNPSYMQGEFSFDYSILNGLKKGKETMEFDAGNKPCVIRVNNPVAGIEIHKKVLPLDGTEDVKYLDTIYMETKLPYLKEYCIEKIQESSTQNTSLPAEFLRYQLKSLIVREKDSQKVVKTANNPKANEERYTVLLQEKLAPETEYEVAYEYIWQNSKDGGKTYKDVDKSEEKGSSSFTTAEADAIITDEILEYAIPGHRQRYWNKDYAISCLKFKKEFPNEKINKIFPTDKKYFYFAYIKEHTASGSVVTHKLPIVNIPFSDTKNKRFNDGARDDFNTTSASREDYQQKYFYDIFNLNGSINSISFIKSKTMTEQGYVSLYGLDELPLQKGSLCNMKIYRVLPKIAFSGNMNEFLGQFAEEETRDQVAIYQNSFAISQYDNLKEKMKDVTASFGVSTHSITNSKRIIGYDIDQTQILIDRSIEDGGKIIPKNTYIGINGNKEGIDHFDIQYLQRKASINTTGLMNFADWTSGLGYMPCMWGLSNPYLDKFFPGANGRFLDHGRLDDNTLGTYLNGRPIDYIIFKNNEHHHKYAITEEEINSGKLNSISLGKNKDQGFIYNENADFDMIIEDGFQSLRTLQYLVLKERLDYLIEYNKNIEENKRIAYKENDQVVLYCSKDFRNGLPDRVDYPADKLLFRTDPNLSNATFTLTSQDGQTETFFKRDYFTGDYYWSILSGKDDEFSFKNTFVIYESNNGIKLPVKRDFLK